MLVVPVPVLMVPMVLGGGVLDGPRNLLNMYKKLGNMQSTPPKTLPHYRRPKLPRILSHETP